MTPVLSLETSRRLYELLGEVETEQYWIKPSSAQTYFLASKQNMGTRDQSTLEGVYPAPSFGELIRLLPALGEKLGWSSHEIQDKHLSIVAVQYMVAPTPQEGMEKVEAYLEKLLV